MTTVINPPALDPNLYRPDFPILGRLVHGDQPLVYLDNAATTQRPRQVIQVDCRYLRKSLCQRAAGHSPVGPGGRRPFCRRGKRCGLLSMRRPWKRLSSLTARPVRSTRLPGVGATPISAPAMKFCLPKWSITRTSCPGSNWPSARARCCATSRLPTTACFRLDTLDQLLTKRTKLVAVTALSNVLGTINPVGEIIRRAHEVGAVALVDGRKACRIKKPTLPSWIAIFWPLAGTRCWGPRASACFTASGNCWKPCLPFLGGGGMIRHVELDRFTPGDLPHKFEAGTPAIVPAIALGAAIDYLNAVGMDAIHRHDRLLTIRAHEVLGKIPGIRIIGPAAAVQRRAGQFCS